jgi:hypothetical protein
MQSRKKIFIHIGTNKTGTSVIQRLLNSKRKELIAQGVLYPRTGCAGDAHYELSRVLGFDYGKQADLQTERAVFLEKFNKELKKSRCETCVISSENFVLPKNVAMVREFFADFDCYIVVYFRRHDHWWVSAYNQAVRMVVHPPWVLGFHGFLDFHRKKNPAFGNYRALLDRWRKVFGQENIIVRPYERQQNQPNIVVDFLTAIGSVELCSILSPSDVPQINKSLDCRSTYLLDTFQRMDIDDHVRRSLIDYVMKNVDSNSDEQIVSPDIRRQLVDKESQQYEYIAQEYLHRPDGVLFFEPPPDPQAVWAKPKYPSLVEVANTVAKVLTAPDMHSK